jgi:hypothetical protein
MPLKLNIGLSRKVGLPRYGSVGASCAVEVELDQGLLFHDVDALHEKVDEAFAACRRAVEEELDRQQQQFQSGTEIPSIASRPNDISNNGPPNLLTTSYALTATERQLRAIEGIAARQQIDVAALVLDRFGKQRVNDLTRCEASRLIDELQAADRRVAAM